MPADFNTFADAQKAGWIRTKSAGPGGVGSMTVYELHLAQDRQSGHAMRVTAIAASGGAADQQALDSLNSYRRMRYGSGDVDPGSTGPRSGQQLVADLS